jgi:hypothetical protein
MKRLFIVLGFLVLSSSAFGQAKPLTQPEFVKLLYAFDKDTSAKTDLIEAVRTRGIGFTLSDGLRSLTRTKSRNDEEVKRVVEEAERRRKDPGAFQRPTAAESAEVLTNAREATLAAVGDMPDFVVKQLIQRAYAYAGTGTFRNSDRLIVGVSYRSTGEEEYKVLSVNGAIQSNPESKKTYEEVGGTSSTGEFVTVLATIFKPESNTTFEAIDSDLVRGRKTITYDFFVEKEKARQSITCTGITAQTTLSGIKGKIWIDRADFRVLRIESEATDIPANFPCTAARRNIEYDWTTILDEKHLLPILSDVRLTIRDKSRLLESRNLIRFREYQKFGTEVKVIEEEDVPEEEEKKPEN